MMSSTMNSLIGKAAGSASGETAFHKVLVFQTIGLSESSLCWGRSPHGAGARPGSAPGPD